MAHKPLYIDTNYLIPLPQSMWNAACEKCDKRQARWDFRASDAPPGSGGFPMCSLCWLYESEWGKARRKDIDEMIREVELAEGKIFQRAKGNRLWSCKEADKILSAIVLTSRMFAIRAQVVSKEPTQP